MSTMKSSATTRKVWVLFNDSPTLWWQRLLKRGFRHCSAVIEDNGKLIHVDSGLNGLTVEIVNELPLLSVSYVSLVYEGGSGDKPLPYGVMTCVEVCKRLIGLDKPLILTPYQLYLYLESYNGRPRQKT